MGCLRTALPADVVVVLGGNVDRRSVAAAEICKRGLVNNLLIADVATSPELGLASTETELAREVLLSLAFQPVRSAGGQRQGRTCYTGVHLFSTF